MTKEEMIKGLDERINRCVETEMQLFGDVITQLHELANDMESKGYLDDYRLDSLLEKIKTYKKFNDLTHTNTVAYNTLKLIDE